MPDVELLSFPECPNVAAARSRLVQAFEQVGLPPEWTELDITGADLAPHARGYGSPTVLVQGQDVVESPAASAQACRVYLGSDRPGVPPLEAIVRALRRIAGARPAG